MPNCNFTYEQEDDQEELHPGERLHRAQLLMEAIAACVWEDAELVMSAMLDEARAGWPEPPYGEIEDEAQFWASVATFEELRAYFIACGQRLVHRKLGQRGRVRMVRRLLEGLPAEAAQDLIVDVFSGRVGQGAGTRVHGTSPTGNCEESGGRF